MQLGKDRPKVFQRMPLCALVGFLAFGVSVSAGIAAEPEEERQRVVTTLKSGGSSATVHALGEHAGREGVADRQKDALRDAGIDPDRADLFWIGGSMVVEASPSEIAKLRTIDDISSVTAEPKVRLASSGASLPTPGGGNWGVNAIGADSVWSELRLTGTGVRVGHIDTGVDIRNPSISGKVIAWRDFVGDRAEPYDDNGHGTHTASTMVGRSVQGSPIGVAPGADLIVAKAIGADGFAPGSQLLAAAQWIADPDGDPTTNDQPDVVNGSWVAGNANDTWFRGVVRDWQARGIVPVFATGNNGPEPGSVGSPAAYPDVIAVGAIDDDDKIGSFSARGPITWQNTDGLGPPAGTRIQKPDLVAPGVAITAGYFDGFLPYTGTSMASPQVAGVVALMRELVPGVSQEDVTAALTSSADDLGAPGPESTYGAGGLDALGALVALGARAGIPDARFAKTPKARTRAARLAYAVSLTAAETYRYRINGRPWSAPTSSPKFAVSAGTGRHRIEIQAVGLDGQLDPTPGSHVVRVDRARPAATVRWSVSGSAVRFTARVRDIGTGVAARRIVWRIGSRTARGRSFTHRFPNANPKRVTLIVTDRAGNRRVVRRIVTPRRATVARASANATVAQGRRLSISGAATRSGRIRATLEPRAAISGSAASPKSVPTRRAGRLVKRGGFRLTLPLRGLPPGRYRLRVEALGRLGRGERTLTRTIRVTSR